MKITRRLILASSGAAAAAAKARARSLNVGGGSAFTPPPPPAIVSITISNTSLQNTGNAVVGSVKVVMSDQSIFNGMISLDTGHGINTEGFHLIGSTLGSNLLAPTGGLPAGSYTDVVIRATQGISTLTIDPTLTAGSLAVTVNGSTSPAPVPSGDSMWIAVRNNPDNNVNTFVAFRPQGTDGSIQRTVFGGAANIDLVIPTTEANQYGQFVGVTPGLYEVILYAYGEGKVLASVLLSISDAVSPPFLLFATPAGAANSNVVFIVEVVGGTVLGGTSAAVVARGTIVLGNTYMSNYSSAQHPQNVTVQFTLSGAPNEIPQTISIGSPIVQSGANPITQTLDTTQYPDGTYIISAKIIDLNDIVHDGGYKWNAYQIVVLPTNLVIANGDPNAPKGLNDFTTPRTIPVAYFFGNVRTQPTGVDYVNYQGLPIQPSNTAPYPGPGQTVVYADPCFKPGIWPWQVGNSPGPIGMRQPLSPSGFGTGGSLPWYFESPAQIRLGEYQREPQFWQTKRGGVASIEWDAKAAGNSAAFELLLPVNIRTGFLDGGRNSNMLSTSAIFIATDQGLGLTPLFSAHWTAVQIDGRLFTIADDGTMTTIAGTKRNTGILPFDWADSTTPEFCSSTIHGTITTDPTRTFANFGGTGDICWDPRNPNVLYAANTICHCILKIDFTVQTVGGIAHGPNNPLCPRYAGYYKGVHGDGLGGYHDGPAIETSPGNGAQFNGPYSIVTQKRTDVPDHPQGTMYVADNYNCLIRMISADGTTVSTLVGRQPGIPPADSAINTYNSTFATQTLLCALPPAGSGPGLVNYAITSITQNADGVHADIVMANPTPVNSIGWKIQILVNGSPFGGSRPGDPGGGVDIGTYYVTGFTDNTHFQVPMNPVPSDSPLILTANIPNADIYSSPGTVPFATAYTAYPQTLRMTSAGNLVLGEAWYNQMLREINLQTRTIRRIGAFMNHPQASASADEIFGWHDTDDVGAIGPVDDILMFKTNGDTSAARWSLAGDYFDICPSDGGNLFASEGTGGVGHYPWAVAISKTQARVLSVGLSNTGLFDWRPFRQGIDPVYITDAGVTETGDGGLCYITWNLGTAVCFPFGLRPSFRALYCSGGTHHYGYNVLPVLDDFPVLYPNDASSSGLVPWVSGAPNGLVQFIQSGLGGQVPRPEFSIDDNPPAGTLLPPGPVMGRDLQKIVYFIRRQSLIGSYPTIVAAPPANLDYIRPQIAITSGYPQRVNSTSIAVHWTTDKQTIGLICAGSPYSQNPSSFGPYPYNLWSDLEVGFGTTHAMTISGLPDASVPGNSPTHIAILVKDKADNWNVSADFTVR